MRKFSKILIIFIFAICLCGVVTKVKAEDPADNSIFPEIKKLEEKALDINLLRNVLQKSPLIQGPLTQYHGENLWMGVGNMTYTNNNGKYYSDIYCIQHGAHINGAAVKYNVSKYMKIVGNVAEVYTYDSINKTYNTKRTEKYQHGVLAYILASNLENEPANVGHSEQQLPPGNYYNEKKLPLNGHQFFYDSKHEFKGIREFYSYRQQLIYSYINIWADQVGEDLGLKYLVYEGNNQYLNQDQNVGQTITNAVKYAGNLADNSPKASIKQTDESNFKENVKVQVDNDFVVVGPFNLTFTGEITNKEFYDGNGNTIQISKIFRYDGNQKEVDTDIQSGKNFYIKISTKYGYNSIKTMKLDVKTTGTSDVYTAKVWFLESLEYQRLILIDGRKTSQDVGDSITQSFDYNIPLTKTITINKRDQDNGRTLEGVKFRIINSKGQYLAKNANGRIEYKASADNTSTIFTTDSHGQIVLNNVRVDTYQLQEIENPNFGYEENAGLKQNIGLSETTVNVYNKLYTKNLTIIKTDQDNQNIFLPGVGFILQCEENGKYVKSSNGVISYVDSESQATQFLTNAAGRFEVRNLIKGTYIAIEKSNPNYGYKIKEGNTIIDKNTIRITITNKLEDIRLSGYVWKDIHSEKQTVRNDLYKSDKNDDKDEGFNDITVRLKHKKDKNFIQTTKTSNLGKYKEINGGQYCFEHVKLSELPNYYLEFEYDGLIWESVIPHTNNNRGSKAIDTNEREALNKNFASVNSTGQNAVNVNNRYRITYTNTVDHKASIKDSSSCTLHADTLQTKYELEYDRETDTELVPEIKYINLGLYERPQADMALVQDLYNVNVGINGYWHLYNYKSRLDKTTGNVPDNSQLWNVGVKFKNENTGTYKRAIYKSDLEYESSDKSKELEVYLTYKIALRNESSYITRVNSIVDYYDNRYKIVAVGTGLSNENAITGAITAVQSSNYDNQYNKAMINVNTTVNPNQTKNIYIQFKLDKNALKQISHNGSTLYNITEINSYTVYKGGKTVAAVDNDSVPGNAKIGNINTYEDDIDSAPPIQLEFKNVRKIQGTVFEDSTSDKLLTGQIRQGDGIFTSGEKRIKDVKVTFHEMNKSIEDMTCTTDANGNFEFSGFIPGQYIITYTWGNKTYKVQNYKGTVYDSNRNQNDMYWYRKDIETRKTDAIDDYNTRKSIDEQIRKITDNTIYAKIEEAYNGNNPNGIITSINSTTPKMEFPVEIDPSDLNGTGNRAEFIVKNVDFGIAERARQVLDLDKRVKAFKVTLANGQILINATVDENGKLQGATNHVTYMGPSANNGNIDSGFIKAELDDELIEGSTLEVQYEIKATNNSELDYTSENYYKYGKQEGKKVTLRPSGVVDYLDKNLACEASRNNNWKQITVDELKEKNAKKMGDTDFLNSKTILYTEALQKDLEPTKSTSVDLNVSKLLTTSNDLTFYNNAEVTKIEKTQQNASTGGIVQRFNADDAEKVIIMPSTGEDKSYVLPIIIGTTSLLILCVGVIIIKKQVIDK